MATTTNFNWSTPDDTALVKDGAAAIRTLGSSIDTSMAELKGGTTGQVLSKTSNTDMDFTWIAVDPLTILDAKGDLISATAADTPARLAVGTNGQVLKANSATATGLEWGSASSTKSFAQLGTATLSSTITTISGLSGYDDFLVMIDGARLTSGNADLRWRFNGNTGSVYTQAGDNYVGSATYATNSNGNTNRFASTACDVGTANSTTGGSVVASLTIRGGNSAGLKVLSGNSGNVDGGGSGSNNRNWKGFFNDTNVISSISLVTLSSTFTAGTITVYGAV